MLGADPVFVHSYFGTAIDTTRTIILLIAVERDVYERSHDTDDHGRAGNA